MTPIITREEVVTICRQFHVKAQHQQCFWRLVDQTEILSDNFGECLLDCRNYRQAFEAIMHAMAEPANRLDIYRKEILQWVTVQTNRKAAKSIVADVFSTLAARHVRTPRHALYSLASERVVAWRRAG